MALNFVPGIDVATAPITAAAGVAKTLLGDHGYAATRGAATWGISAFNGFVPVNPMYWPLQVPLFIVVILILIFVVGVNVKWAFVWAYVVQGLLVMSITHWFLDKFLQYGIAV